MEENTGTPPVDHSVKKMVRLLSAAEVPGDILDPTLGIRKLLGLYDC